MLASVMTPSMALSSLASLASLVQLSVQDAPKLQGRRRKIARWNQRGREAHTLCTELHRAAPSDDLILGTGRGWTAENKER